MKPALSLLVAALLLHARVAPAAAQSTRIHISAPSKSLSWFPIHLAREKGFYRAEGLDVDYVIMKPQVAMQALIAGDVGYTTALGSTMRAAFRNVPLRVVMTIADKPLFALIARSGIARVEDLKGKVLGISSFGASTDTYARALLRGYKLIPNQDVNILALGGGTSRVAAMESGAIDAALIEAPYNVMLERKGFRRILFVGDLISSPLAGLGTRLNRIQKQPDEIQRLVRATLRGIQLAKGNKSEAVQSMMKWADMNQELAEGSYEMAAQSWSATGVASRQGLQIAMEEIRVELKLDFAPDPAKAFDFTFVQK
jgi:NitT/TauT family transport system substrate-binding protein